jgi:hypothetical protein
MAQRERAFQGGLELQLVVLVEQLEQPRDLPAEVLSAERERLDERVGARPGGAEPVAASEFAGTDEGASSRR